MNLTELRKLLGPTTPRGPRANRCQSCKQIILGGLDDDICAMHDTADWHPVNALGEALIHLGGGRTIALTWDGDGSHLRLQRREAKQITKQSAGSPGFDVLPIHHCGQALPAPIPSAWRPISKTTIKEGSDECPF